MSDADFEGHKRAVVTKRLEKVKNLDQETGRHWAQIANEYYDFEAGMYPSWHLVHDSGLMSETAQEDADQVKKLTKSEMIDYYARHILPSSPDRAKLVVYLVAQGISPKSKDAPAENGETETVPTNGTVPYVIQDVREYKSRMEVTVGARPVCELSEFEDIEAKL